MTEPSASTPGAARLADLLRAGRFVMTAEVTPPVSCDRDDLMGKALPLRGVADAVNLTDGAGARAHMSAPVAAAMLAAAGIEPILQFTCRDRNRIALQSELLGAAAAGVQNLLILTGDDPKVGDQPEAKPVFDLDTIALTELARAIRDRGELPHGRKVAGHAQFFIGAADAPIDPPPAGSRASSPPRSRPASSSRRPSSAWTPAWCAAIWRGSPSTRRRAPCIC